MDDSPELPLRLPPQEPVGELVWVAGGEVDECAVSLRFFGDDLDPDEVTRSLNLTPTISYKKGDIFRSKKYDIIRKTGSWRYAVKRCADVHLEDQINNLLDKLPSDLEVWQRLTQIYQADLFCGLWLKRWNCGLDFAPETLKRMGDRNITLSLDMYVDFDDEEA